VPKKVKLSELEQIGLNVRKARELKELSRAQVAFELDTTEKQITRVEYGEVNSGILTFVKLAKVLEVDIAYFFQKIK